MKKRIYAPNLKIPAEVAENLGFYVYLYIDPRNGQIKYVGKGRTHALPRIWRMMANLKKKKPSG